MCWTFLKTNVNLTADTQSGFPVSNRVFVPWMCRCKVVCTTHLTLPPWEGSHLDSVYPVPFSFTRCFSQQYLEQVKKTNTGVIHQKLLSVPLSLTVIQWASRTQRTVFGQFWASIWQLCQRCLACWLTSSSQSTAEFTEVFLLLFLL